MRDNCKQITIGQVEEIMREDFKFFKKVTETVFCGNCGETTIKGYTIYLDEKGYIILQGLCSKCDKKVARVIETGEDLACVKRAKKIYNAIG